MNPIDRLRSRARWAFFLPLCMMLFLPAWALVSISSRMFGLDLPAAVHALGFYAALALGIIGWALSAWLPRWACRCPSCDARLDRFHPLDVLAGVTSVTIRFCTHCGVDFRGMPSARHR